jgi:hypothetical protein
MKWSTGYPRGVRAMPTPRFHMFANSDGGCPCGCSCRKITIIWSRWRAAASKLGGHARLRHQPISAGRKPISTLPADSYCARNALLC